MVNQIKDEKIMLFKDCMDSYKDTLGI